MKGIFDFDHWVAWFRLLDSELLYLLILAAVILVVGLWSRSLRLDKNREQEND